jgi:hypothetical protein
LVSTAQGQKSLCRAWFVIERWHFDPHSSGSGFYFPQNQLSPPDANRYRKFKLMVGAGIAVLTLFLIGAGVGIYYLIQWLAS